LRARGVLAGSLIVAIFAIVGVRDLIAALPQTRTISLYNIHTKETLSVEYKRNGKFVPEAMDKIDWIFRDWRRDEKTKMDPELVDLLWEAHTELGSNEPIHIISGYRSRTTNDMLRKTVGGQASESRHILGKAADVQFPDVPLRRLRYSALVRERGGVGYYPTSATPFVHVDTDRVRAWPRLPRNELALLFPNGRTQHVPADGAPITKEDVEAARAHRDEAAIQVAEFQELRRNAFTGTRLASLNARPQPALPPRRAAEPKLAALTVEQPEEQPRLPEPKLVSEPRLIDRPSHLFTNPSPEDRLKLAQLATLAGLPERQPVPAPAPARSAPTNARLASLSPDALSALLGVPAGSRPEGAQEVVAPIDPGSAAAAGRFAWGGAAWAVAPEYDEEHPEELSYRPFPIAPYMTDSASPDDPAFTALVHPDVARTLDLLDQAGSMPPMKLRPGPQVAKLLWAQEFKGQGSIAPQAAPSEPTSRDGLTNRRVKLSGG
jgi:uncharacterized protein YcbK (DUF882 family)